MPLSYIFWGLYIAAVVLGGWGYYGEGPTWYRRFGGYLILWILVGILGWHVFGSAIK